MNDDIYLTIFNLLSLSDKRAFVCFCKKMTQFSRLLRKIGLEFQEMINNGNFLGISNSAGFYNTIHKHTIELLYDDYAHLIPDAFITGENRILYRYPKIYKRLGKKGDLSIIKKLFQSERHSSSNIRYLANGAAKAGNINILEWIATKYDIFEGTISHAVSGNQIETLKWLRKRYGFKTYDDSVIKYAAKKNHIEMLEFLILKKKCKGTYGGYHSSRNGRLDIVKFLFSHVPITHHESFLFDVRDGAISGGHIEILEFAFSQGYSLSSQHVPCSDINILHWLINNKHIKLCNNTLESIVQEGNFECFEHVYKLISPVNKRVLDKAVEYGHEKIVRFLLDAKCEYNSFTILAATNYLSRSLHVLRLFKTSEWLVSISRHAALHGDLELLQYGYDNKCVSDATIINYAAKHGHLNVIIWAREHNYEWDTVTILNAIENGYLDVIKWLRNVNNYRATCGLPTVETEICPWDERVCLSAIKHDDINILKFAIDNGCDYGDATYAAAEKCSGEIKNYLTLKKIEQ